MTEPLVAEKNLVFPHYIATHNKIVFLACKTPEFDFSLYVFLPLFFLSFTFQLDVAAEQPGAGVPVLANAGAEHPAENGGHVDCAGEAA